MSVVSRYMRISFSKQPLDLFIFKVKLKPRNYQAFKKPFLVFYPKIPCYPGLSRAGTKVMFVKMLRFGKTLYLFSPINAFCCVLVDQFQNKFASKRMPACGVNIFLSTKVLSCSQPTYHNIFIKQNLIS